MIIIVAGMFIVVLTVCGALALIVAVALLGCEQKRGP